MLINTSDNEFNELSRSYIEDLIKLSSIIMFKVKSSSFYKKDLQKLWTYTNILTLYNNILYIFKYFISVLFTIIYIAITDIPKLIYIMHTHIYIYID